MVIHKRGDVGMFREKWVQSQQDFQDAALIRDEVFVKEQGFENELDDIDAVAHHVVFYDEAGTPLATGRAFPAQEQEDGIYKIGRVCVRRCARGTGAGRAVMEALERKIKSLGGCEAQLGAQIRAKEFYKHLGYQEFGEPFLDEGCPHIMMKKSIV